MAFSILKLGQKQIFLINSLNQFSPLKNHYHFLASPRCVCTQDLNHEGGLPPDSDLTTDPQQDSTVTMPDINISQNELLKLLKNLKPVKAAGPDRLKPLLLRELREEIAPIIKIFFDRSLQIGKLPTDWMTANVMPVSKRGDKSLAENYRPISLHSLQGA